MLPPLPESRPIVKWLAGYYHALQSVIGNGTISELHAAEDKSYGLRQIMRHYSAEKWTFDPIVVDKTRIWRIEIQALTGKRSHV